MKSRLYIFPLVFMAFLLANCVREESPVTVKPDGKKRPDQEIWNFQVKTTNKGKLEAVILAGHMQQFSQESLALFDQGVKIDFYDENGEHASQLTADGGEYDDDTQNVKATGNVVVVSDSGITLYTDELYYYRDRDKIISEKPVKVETEKGHILHGIGFESDTNMDYWEIRKPYDGESPEALDLSFDRFEKKAKADSAAADSLAADSTMVGNVSLTGKTNVADTSKAELVDEQK